MIITRILGGLGNQLFQYAAGRALAVQNNTELKLDLSGFDTYTLRSFELSRLNARFSIASNEEIDSYKAVTFYQRMMARLSPPAQKRFYKEPFFHYDGRFFLLRAPVYLQGYFQSEKYFEPVAKTLRDEFRFREAFSPPVMAFAKELASSNSVALHVRRGDYKNPNALRVHGMLPEAYYQKAITQLMDTAGNNLRFYIFSDDPQAAAKMLALPDAKTVSGRLTKNHLEDFYLMQHCRHNIIANSSFSWWAAWLNPNPQKKVVAPQQWFGKGGPKDTGDLLPQSWLQV